MTEPSIVIVGAGHAGGRAAEALRSAGHGGKIVLIGSELHPPYERPPLSKELLAGKLRVEKTYLRPRQFYDDANIELLLGTSATGIDRRAQRIELSDGRTVPYDALMLTTGARARRPPIPGNSSSRILYLRNIEDCLTLQKYLHAEIRLAVIGAGFIGLEVAATARRLGAHVTIVESAPYPLARVAPREIGEYVARLHYRNGVIVHTGVRIAEIKQTNHSISLCPNAGGIIEADLAIVGVGAIPNTDLAEEAGLNIEDGVLVDEYGYTSDPNIFAAGDVTRHFNPLIGRRIRLESWQNAQNQSVAVAKVIVGGKEPFSEAPWFWTDQYEMNLQMVGIATDSDQLVWRGTPDDPSFTLFHLADGKPIAATTVNNAREMRFARILVALRRPVDAKALSDKTVKLHDLAL